MKPMLRPFAAFTRRTACAAFGLVLFGAAHAQGAGAISIGIGPFMSGFDVRYAVNKGYFKEQGLDVNLVVLTAGSQAVPQLLGGQLHFAQVDTIVAVTARSRNVPVVITAQNIIGGTRPERGYGNLIVPATSGIQSVKDLAGKSIAVNQINGSAWAFTRGTIDAAGADSAKSNFLEVPPPQLLAALQQGRADAAVIAEPLAATAVAQGMKVLANVEATTVPSLPVFAFISSEAWARANPETVRKFNVAIDRAHRELNENPALALEIAKSATQLPPDVLGRVHFPVFGTGGMDPSQLQKVVDFAVKYGLVPKDKVPPVQTLHLSTK